jgi:hypothetical protein
MRTSLNEIQAIEKYLLGKHDGGDSIVFEARLQINPQLRLNLHLQKKLLMLVKLFHRKKLKEEAEAVSVKIFSDPEKKEFQERVSQIFNR